MDVGRRNLHLALRSFFAAAYLPAAEDGLGPLPSPFGFPLNFEFRLPNSLAYDAAFLSVNALEVARLLELGEEVAF